ncbi:hypothetical protein MLD38_020332 [Melastoma candidum]|uniref:Uncharacterized protein n=1 Tax=Melastoma candidum TaxID=119954 RepID=A0ACB9QKL8_9MYRT|nr:hypothetical protein MLD38_020332 [Melastoma candidum]
MSLSMSNQSAHSTGRFPPSTCSGSNQIGTSKLTTGQARAGPWMTRQSNGLCELPSLWGPYRLCKPRGEGCSCQDNQINQLLGPCTGPVSTGLCTGSNQFKVLGGKTVELPYKELMVYQTASSPEECEHACKSNCSCWGADLYTTTCLSSVTHYITRSKSCSVSETRTSSVASQREPQDLVPWPMS